mgnify:FL=1
MAACSHHETCGVCHTSGPCDHNGKLELFIVHACAQPMFNMTGQVGFDLNATIAWRRAMAADPELPLLKRAEHEQMVDWLVELKNLRTLL